MRGSKIRDKRIYSWVAGFLRSVAHATCGWDFAKMEGQMSKSGSSYRMWCRYDVLQPLSVAGTAGRRLAVSPAGHSAQGAGLSKAHPPPKMKRHVDRCCRTEAWPISFSGSMFVSVLQRGTSALTLWDNSMGRCFLTPSRPCQKIRV